MFTNSESDIVAIQSAGTQWPASRMQAVAQGAAQELRKEGAEALLKGTANMLLISLGEYNTAFVAPALRQYAGDLYVCIFRTHEGDEFRGRMQK